VPPESGGAPIADALLVQLIRTLWVEPRRHVVSRGRTLAPASLSLPYAAARGLKERYSIEEVARQVPGVLGVVNKIRVTRAL